MQPANRLRVAEWNAKLKFVEAIEMRRHTASSWGNLSVRRRTDGQGILPCFWGDRRVDHEVECVPGKAL